MAMGAAGTRKPRKTGIKPPAAGGRNVDCLADLGGDPVLALAGGTKERERFASGNLVTTKLGRCGLGSNVLVACEDGNTCGFWDA